MRNYTILFIFIGLLNSALGYSQDVNFKIGIKDSILSKTLNEKRPLIISLPKNYETTTKTYPVLYVLDGNVSGVLDAINVTRSLGAEMIIVAILNTDRDRDMMPLSAPSYEVDNPGAENFLAFIGDELIPHIEENYRSNGQSTIRGRSLSGLFVMYVFLKRPELFDNYIGNCAGWFADMNYFFDPLTDTSFKKENQYNGKAMFVANSLSDPLDPNKEIHQSIIDLSKRINNELNDQVKFEYMTYENGGHVPYSSFYEGLKFILQQQE